ncbi:hypothetical protein YC2023_067246 [Brassica napus]
MVGYHTTVKEETMGQVIGRNGHYSGQQTYLSEFEEELPWLRVEQMDIPYENCMNNHVESLMLDQSGGYQNLEPEMIQETA